jgi:Mycothiol maleylpyruvate isomerase N-terminal domain
VPLSFTGAVDRTAVVRAAEAIVDLVSRPEVAAQWQRESSCPGMTVGGLTWHLVSQPGMVVSLVGAGPDAGTGSEIVDVLEHYARARWVSEDVDGETNRAIREAADTQASDGPEAAVTFLLRARAGLDAVLAAAPATTYVPWQGWSLATDDFVVTRLMETVVHADDLAASIGVSTPAFDTAVLDPVLRLLTALALRRHGQDALVRTLTRPQRAPAEISAF